MSDQVCFIWRLVSLLSEIAGVKSACLGAA